MTGEGLEVAVDLADLVQVLQQENAELHQQVSMLKAAVMKQRREAAAQPNPMTVEAEPVSNGAPL